MKRSRHQIKELQANGFLSWGRQRTSWQYEGSQCHTISGRKPAQVAIVIDVVIICQHLDRRDSLEKSAQR